MISIDKRAVIEYNNQNWWTSDDQDPKWIKFNFTNKRILLTNYSVQSLDASKNSPHAKKWITQGYNDKNQNPHCLYAPIEQ